MRQTRSAIDALALSALPRLEYLRKHSIPDRMAGLGMAALTPIIMYTATYALNSVMNVQYPSPGRVGMVAGLTMLPAPFLFADSLRLLRGSGKNLSYNPGKNIVAKLNDNLTDSLHGFYPLLLGESPFLLQKGEARIMPLRTYYASESRGFLEATIDNSEMMLNVPYGVLFEENSEGIGALKRQGKYSFGLLAFAPYDSFL